MKMSRLPVWASPAELWDLLRLAGPIAISRLSMMLMSLTDAVVLGRYAPGELPFILNSWLPVGVTLGLGIGLMLGVQVLTSELMGIGEEKQSGRIFRRGFWLAAGLGLVIAVLVFMTARPLFHYMFVVLAPGSMSDSLPAEQIAASSASATRILALALPGFMLSSVAGYYLEALRRPLVVTIVSYIGVLVNLVFDLALVGGWWGFEPMGADGVAMATSASRWAIAIILLILVAAVTPAWKASQPGPPDEGRRQLAVGAGTAISNIAEWGSFNFTFIIATWVSLAANAVYGYSMQIMSLLFMVFLGIGSATSVRVAEAFGRGDRQQVRGAARLGIVATLLVGIAMGIIILCFNDTISQLMVDADKAVIDGVWLAPMIAALLVYVAIGTVVDGLQATASMALRAQEIVWLPTLFHIGSFLFVMIPAGYWLGIVQGRGARGMMEAAVLALTLAGLLQTALLEWKTARGL